MGEKEPEPLDVDLDKIESVALRRLIEEVRLGEIGSASTAYNRSYHRHNR